MKLWKCVKPEEVINVGELYRRYFGESGSPYDEPMTDTIKIKTEDYENAISEIDALSNEVCAYAPNDMVDRLREIAESFKNLLPKEE